MLTFYNFHTYFMQEVLTMNTLDPSLLLLGIPSLAFVLAFALRALQSKLGVNPEVNVPESRDVYFTVDTPTGSV